MLQFDNLSDKDHNKLLKVINGALRSCIQAHGPITENLIGSAGKRIVGALKSYDQSLAMPQKPLTVKAVQSKCFCGDAATEANGTCGPNGCINSQ